MRVQLAAFLHTHCLAAQAVSSAFFSAHVTVHCCGLASTHCVYTSSSVEQCSATCSRAASMVSLRRRVVGAVCLMKLFL
jgi:hypothetical protein